MKNNASFIEIPTERTYCLCIMNKLIIFNVIRFVLLVRLLYIYLYDFGFGLIFPICFDWISEIELLKMILLQLAIILFLIGKPRKPEIILLTAVFGVNFLWSFFVHKDSLGRVFDYLVEREYLYNWYYLHKFLWILSDWLGFCLLIILLAKFFISSTRYTIYAIKYYKLQKQDKV